MADLNESHLMISSVSCVRLVSDTVPRSRPFLECEDSTASSNSVLYKQVLEFAIVRRGHVADGSDVQPGIYVFSMPSNRKVFDSMPL